jgi:hypothetical protein
MTHTGFYNIFDKFSDFFFVLEESKVKKKRNYEITRTVLGMEASEMSVKRIL